MDIKQLRYFIAIAEEGSLSAASVRLGIAQPSLSQQVLKIEQELGVTLVSRSPRGVTLTGSGEILLHHARQICQSMNSSLDIVRRSGGVLQGSVVIGLPSSISMVLSVPLAETIRHSLPGVRLRVVDAMSGSIQEWLQDETVDLGILFEHDGGKTFEAQKLGEEYLHFYTAADNWPLDMPAGEPVTLSEIAGLDMVLPSRHNGLRRTIDAFANSVGLALNVYLEMDALSQMKELVGRGSAYTILTPAAVHDCVARGEFISSPIIEPAMTRQVYLVRKSSRPQTYVSCEVERIMLEVIRDLVDRGIWAVSQPVELAS